MAFKQIVNRERMASGRGASAGRDDTSGHPTGGGGQGPAG